MWLKDLRWFRRTEEKGKDLEEAILNELQGVKKLVRKQGILLEELHKERSLTDTKERWHPGPVMDLCDALFYLGRALRAEGSVSSRRGQALNLVMEKVEHLADLYDLEVIIIAGVDFDPGIHEAVANQSPGARALQVLEVLQPGYLWHGKVLRPAKVTVGANSELSPLPEGAGSS